MTTESFEHTRFGVLEYEKAEVIHFDGLPGFGEARRFVIRSHDRGRAFAWLVSLDDPSLALVLTNPWHFFPDYAPEVCEAMVGTLGASRMEDIDVLAVVTATARGYALNLAAPILIHARTQRGMQLILNSDLHPVHGEVAAGALPAAVAAPSDRVEAP